MESFNLFGTKWKIKDVEKIVEDETKHEVFGLANTVSNVIEIADTVYGIKQVGDLRELTKLHEIVHAILYTGQYLTCNEDEPLVEWIARCLLQLKKLKIL